MAQQTQPVPVVINAVNKGRIKITNSYVLSPSKHEEEKNTKTHTHTFNEK